MKRISKAKIGDTDVKVSQFGFGGVFISDPDEITTDGQSAAVRPGILPQAGRWLLGQTP